MANREEVIQLRLESELKKKAARVAVKEGRTLSSLLRYALIQYLSMPKGTQQ